MVIIIGGVFLGISSKLTDLSLLTSTITCWKFTSGPPQVNWPHVQGTMHLRPFDSRLSLMRTWRTLAAWRERGSRSCFPKCRTSNGCATPRDATRGFCTSISRGGSLWSCPCKVSILMLLVRTIFSYCSIIVTVLAGHISITASLLSSKVV